MKHTPSPWKATNSGMVVGLETRPVCEIVEYGPYPKDREMDLANAMLIEAAPELLEHLKWALTRIDPMNRGNCWERAMDVVKKAEGKK